MGPLEKEAGGGTIAILPVVLIQKPISPSCVSSLCDMLISQLARRWSPRQIAGWLKVTVPNHVELRVSHECSALWEETHVAQSEDAHRADVDAAAVTTLRTPLAQLADLV